VSDGGVIVATVVPDVSGLDKSFDYLVAENVRDVVRVGSMVRVVLAGRRVGGWVIRLGSRSDVPADRLIPLAKWSGHGPDGEIIDLGAWAADRWGADRLRPFLVVASPPVMVRSLPPTPVPTVRPTSSSRELAPGVASAAIERLVGEGGGVIRISPSDDVVPIVAGAVSLGPTLIVHPSLYETGVLARRLRASGLRVAVLPADWATAAAGACDVVLGGRNAVWATVPDLASIVVLDEHDDRLQNERTPTWHARDVAIERARRRGIPCVLVSPCPTVTALHWSGRRWMHPTIADERAGWPIVDVIDRTDEAPWQRSLLTSTLIAHLRVPDRRVVCVHNTPGRSRLLACRSCRSLLVCERCEAAVEQRDDGVLWCRRCGTERPPVCQHCGSGALANVRPGVSRLRDELEAAANRPVVAVTGESPLEPDPAGVYVGTEAVLHRLHAADVVAFLDFDAELLAPRYRAAEQAMALLVRAARLLGPRANGGRLVVQTFSPRHPVIDAALFNDPGRLAKVEAASRRDLGLPPFGALARVSGPAANEFVASTGLASAPDGDGWLVRAATWDELGPVLAHAPRPKASRLRVEVDPPRR
jgi:primosomal protein N' (replication factor Y) (superfamily II helicase)